MYRHDEQTDNRTTTTEQAAGKMYIEQFCTPYHNRHQQHLYHHRQYCNRASIICTTNVPMYAHMYHRLARSTTKMYHVRQQKPTEQIDRRPRSSVYHVQKGSKKPMYSPCTMYQKNSDRKTPTMYSKRTRSRSLYKKKNEQECTPSMYAHVQKCTSSR